MNRCLVRLLVPAGLLLLCSLGCRAFTPAVSYYTLRSISEVPAQTGSTPGKPAPIIAIGEVGLPGDVNRLQMVRRTATHRIEVAAYHRWADYPDRMIPKLLRDNLQTLLPEARVVMAPWAVGLKPDVTVSFQFLELIGSTDEKMVLRTVWTLEEKRGAGPTRPERFELTEPIGGAGFDDLAEAHSRVLADLSRDVANRVRTVLYTGG